MSKKHSKKCQKNTLTQGLWKNQFKQLPHIKKNTKFGCDEKQPTEKSAAVDVDGQCRPL